MEAVVRSLTQTDAVFTAAHRERAKFTQRVSAGADVQQAPFP